MEDTLVTRAQIADRLRVSRTRVGQLAKTRGFPEPAETRGRTGLYRESEVAVWARRRGRRYPVNAAAPERRR